MAKTIKIEIPVQAIVKTPTVNLEVPEGCTAKYDAATQTIKFIPEDYTVIKDFETACKVLGISSAIPDEIQNDRQICAIYKMKIVLRAVNQNYTFNLITGKIWYPYVRFIGKDNVERYIDRKESKILDFNYDGDIFTLVGGGASDGSDNGLGDFRSYGSIGHYAARNGFFACHDEQRAHHVSKYFAALIFDCCFAGELGFSLNDGEMVIKDYHIENKN